MDGIGVDPQPFRDLMGALGINVVDDGALWVVVVDHYLRAELAAHN
ncbi:MAG TPA: hypothetical protein VN699_08665 [Pirellulales bacterium]|nr:hypothetical protein [Pirellulales bacterium]